MPDIIGNLEIQVQFMHEQADHLEKRIDRCIYLFQLPARDIASFIKNEMYHTVY
ncbi:MAG: hypothetical protein ABI707_16285 [Ferruginibacter sp.]